MMKAIVCLMLLLLAACVPAPAALASTPATSPASASTTSDPGAVSRACKVDADCAVKDVGSCCGRHPACVNKDAATDPNAVRAQCAKENRASVCSIEAIGGCSCVQGECRNINAAQMPGKH